MKKEVLIVGGPRATGGKPNQQVELESARVQRPGGHFVGLQPKLAHGAYKLAQRADVSAPPAETISQELATR